ncbi:hypothetical protein CVT25_000673 [Psilocybe cyanescens]|uniref:Uncharacterized protein n=1 Tax=Psilocybe cyanescens TaxID=93625 RepID=A0A409WZH0_PSICY|nr:hypothetical protein CVT25_000673 [Psilocybe cyanescens]
MLRNDLRRQGTGHQTGWITALFKVPSRVRREGSGSEREVIVYDEKRVEEKEMNGIWGGGSLENVYKNMLVSTDPFISRQIHAFDWPSAYLLILCTIAPKLRTTSDASGKENARPSFKSSEWTVASASAPDVVCLFLRLILLEFDAQVSANETGGLWTSSPTRRTATTARNRRK